VSNEANEVGRLGVDRSALFFVLTSRLYCSMCAVSVVFGASITVAVVVVGMAAFGAASGVTTDATLIYTMLQRVNKIHGCVVRRKGGRRQK